MTAHIQRLDQKVSGNNMTMPDVAHNQQRLETWLDTKFTSFQEYCDKKYATKEEVNGVEANLTKSLKGITD